MPHPAPPSTLVPELRQITLQELSLPSRLRYVALLLAASAMTAVVFALLLTEPALPARTRAAFDAIALMGVTWQIFAIWVLARKRALLGHHRLVAGRIAVTFNSVFVVGALGLGLVTLRPAPFVAAAIGSGMLAIAVVILIRARRRWADLSRRRAELERNVEGGLR